MKKYEQKQGNKQSISIICFFYKFVGKKLILQHEKNRKFVETGKKI